MRLGAACGRGRGVRLLLLPLLLLSLAYSGSATATAATGAGRSSSSSSSSSSTQHHRHRSTSHSHDERGSSSTAAFLGTTSIHRGHGGSSRLHQQPQHQAQSTTTTMGRMRMAVAGGGWGASRGRLGLGPAAAGLRPSTRLHASSASATPLGDSSGLNDPTAAQPQWRRVGGEGEAAVDVLFPPDFAVPKGIVHFVGGAVVGAFPRASYGPLLERLAVAGYCVVATPLPFSPFDHTAAAHKVAGAYGGALPFLRDVYGPEVIAELPIFGLGHSLGAKLHVLLSALNLAPERRRANVLVSFNNFSAQESIPLLSELRRLGEAAVGAAQPGGGLDGLEEKLDGVLDFISGIEKLTAGLGGGGAAQHSQSQQQQQREEMRRGIEAGKRGVRMALDFLNGAVGGNGVGVPGEFVPSPEETWKLVEDAYPVPRNLIVSFDKDSIDQSSQLSFLLARRFPSSPQGGPRVASTKLPGTHITPNTPASVLELADDPFAASASSYSGYPSSSSSSSSVALAPFEGDAVGQAWADESGFAAAAGEAGRAAARKAKRELDALASAVVAFLDESPSWPIDPLGSLPA